MTTLATADDDQVKISARIPNKILALASAKHGRPSQGVREALEEWYRMKTDPRLRAKEALLASLPKGPPPPRDIAMQLYDRWAPLPQRGVSETGQLDLVHGWMVDRAWIPGPKEIRRAKPWTVDRAREVLDALRGIDAAKRGLSS